MFCQHCGKPIAEGSVFCNYCGGQQGVVKVPTAGAEVATLMDELYADVDDIAEDSRYFDFPPGWVIHLRAKVESGGPYELLVFDEEANLLRTFGGIVTESTFDYAVPEEGALGFDFQSTGASGTVRLRVF